MCIKPVLSLPSENIQILLIDVCHSASSDCCRRLAAGPPQIATVPHRVQRAVASSVSMYGTESNQRNNILY